jgi:hypothetical protein
MSSASRPIPQPSVLAPAAPPPEIAAQFEPRPPTSLTATQIVTDRGVELAVVFKRTYGYDAQGRCRLADEQIPLDADGQPHEPLGTDVPPSSKSLPEIIGFKTGTDVVIQASARSPRPTTTMNVAAQIGSHRHSAVVFGRRVCDYSQGRLVFTPPEPFESMPLRYENAYGGRDRVAEQRFVEEAQRAAKPDDWRSTAAVLEFLLGAIHPLMYPRNRFGKGYVLDDRRESIQGRELPNVESAGDLLTPERLIVPNPLQWSRQPLPVSFDFLDAYSFPRCAMLGLPPATTEDLKRVPEVVRKLIPEDYCRGNAVTASNETLANILHPDGSRCASLGLWLPWQRGNEELRLEGMDAAAPTLRLPLPGERPAFAIQGLKKEQLTMDESQLHLVHLSVDKRLLNLVWVARMPLPRNLFPGEDRQLGSSVRVEMKRV